MLIEALAVINRSTGSQPSWKRYKRELLTDGCHPLLDFIRPRSNKDLGSIELSSPPLLRDANLSMGRATQIRCSGMLPVFSFPRSVRACSITLSTTPFYVFEASSISARHLRWISIASLKILYFACSSFEPAPEAAGRTTMPGRVISTYKPVERNPLFLA